VDRQLEDHRLDRQQMVHRLNHSFPNL
jgi:hypothetical protein